MQVWDFVNSINFDKRDLFEGDPQSEKDYTPFVVNRALSYFPDTVLYANEMNLVSTTAPKKWQYDFLRLSVSKRKRFSKWAKKSHSDNLAVVMEYYKYSAEKALEALSILSEQQLQLIKQQMDKGGRP